MKFFKGKGFWAVFTVFLVLLADQILKIWVKTHMALYQDFQITSWFHIYFIENNGIAFGFEVIGKLFLSVFRILASIGIAWYLYKLIKCNYKTSYIICIALIFAGAVGNIVDSVFYGVIFDSSYNQVATLFPPGGGYSTWLHGKVVDMFYFPVIRTHWPDWMPFCGGEEFIFFRPIFNLADSAISVGVIILLLFHRKMLKFGKEEQIEQ